MNTDEKPTNDLRYLTRKGKVVAIQRRWKIGKPIKQDSWYDDPIEYRDVWRNLPCKEVK